jgi:hypothetical protein
MVPRSRLDRPFRFAVAPLCKGQGEPPFLRRIPEGCTRTSGDLISLPSQTGLELTFRPSQTGRDLTFRPSIRVLHGAAVDTGPAQKKVVVEGRICFVYWGGCCRCSMRGVMWRESPSCLVLVVRRLDHTGMSVVLMICPSPSPFSSWSFMVVLVRRLTLSCGSCQSDVVGSRESIVGRVARDLMMLLGCHEESS